MKSIDVKQKHYAIMKSMFNFFVKISDSQGIYRTNFNPSIPNGINTDQPL